MAADDAGYVNNVLQALLDHVYECLEDTIYGKPKDKYLAFTRPPDDCCDYVAVWFTRMLPTKSFPEVDESANQCGFTQRMIEVKIKLRRSCWPVIRDNPNSPFPPPGDIQQAAEKLTVDANVLWCCLSGGFLRPVDEPRCLATRVAEIEPDTPEGGCAGMTATLWIELEGCCSGDAV